jgi:hypothetical protein
VLNRVDKVFRIIVEERKQNCEEIKGVANKRKYPSF